MCLISICTNVKFSHKVDDYCGNIFPALNILATTILTNWALSHTNLLNFSTLYKHTGTDTIIHTPKQSEGVCTKSYGGLDDRFWILIDQKWSKAIILPPVVLHNMCKCLYIMCKFVLQIMYDFLYIMCELFCTIYEK